MTQERPSSSRLPPFSETRATAMTPRSMLPPPPPLPLPPYARPTGRMASFPSSNPSRVGGMGLGFGSGSRGFGRPKKLKRHMKKHRDSIKAVTKGDIRRLARRGGVKRISRTVYDDVRYAIKARLTSIMEKIVALVELRGRKTVCVADVVYALNSQGRTLYGFDG